MSWLSKLSIGMPVRALDAPVGSIASVPRIDLEDATSPSDIIVLASEDNAGPEVEEFLRVPREMIDRIDSGVVYLNVNRRQVPRASAAVAATHRLEGNGNRLTIPVSEEVVDVQPRVVERGHLHIRKKVDEYLDERAVRLLHHEVQVERVPKDEVIPEVIQPYMDGDVYIVPVIEEEVVIQRRLRLTEELRVHRSVAEREELVQTPFLRERVIIEEHRYDEDEAAEPREH